MSGIMDYLIPMIAVLVIAFACAVLRKKGEFSINIFLSSISVSIAVLVWIPLVPSYMIVFSILILVGMLFAKGDSTTGEVTNE